MTKIKNLDFDFDDGACNVFPQFGILLCFGRSTSQESSGQDCHSFDVSRKGTITIQKEISSHYTHTDVRSLGSYKGSPFVTGGGYSAVKNKKTELLNIETEKWEVKADYPTERYLNFLSYT